MATRGRPTIRSKELEDAILECIADGMSVREICLSEDMPTRSTVFRWLAEDPAFSDLYAKAKEAQAELMADELLEISDNGTNDWMMRNGADGADGADGNAGWQLNGEAIQRSRLRVDTRKWVAAKLLPRKYGDKQTLEHTGKDGGPLEVNIVIGGHDAKD